MNIDIFNIGHLSFVGVEKQDSVFREEAVHVFQFQTFGLREEEIDDRYKECIQCGKNDVGFPANVCDSNGRNLYDHLR